MVMNDTFPDYREYLIKRCTPFMPHKVKQFDHWTIEQLEEANGKLTQLRFERDFDWNIFDREEAKLSVPVKKAMKAKYLKKSVFMYPIHCASLTAYTQFFYPKIKIISHFVINFFLVILLKFELDSIKF